MAPTRKEPESTEAKPVEKARKPAPKTGIKNPFVYIGTIIILVITIIAFVFIPSVGGGLGSSSTAPRFGTWDGKPITYKSGSYFATQVAQINDYLRQQGLSEENFQLYAYQVWRMAFQSTAIRAAVLDTVKKSGFQVTEAGLDKAVSQNAAFQVDGAFSLETYNKTPRSTRMSIRDSTRDDLTISRFYEDMYTLAPSSAEISFVASMVKPQRSISYFSIPLASFPDSEVKAWGEKNTDLFRTLGLSRITVTSSEADAKKILKQIKDNSLAFEDAAKSHSQDAYADKGGDAGTQFYHAFAEDFSNKDEAAKIAALPKGEVSDVVNIAEKTWAIFRVNAELAPADLGRQATFEEVKNYLYDRERGTMESWAVAEATRIAGSTEEAGFRKSVEKAGYSLKNAGPFFISLGNPTFYAYNQQIPLFQPLFDITDPLLQQAQSDEAFMTELFALAKGKVSKPLVINDAVLAFSVTSDADGKEDDAAMVQFSYPYFHQQTIESQTRNTFLASKRLKDEFNTTFFKVFQTGSGSNTATTTTTVTEAK